MTSPIFGNRSQQNADPFAGLRSLEPITLHSGPTKQTRQDRLAAASRRFRRPAELLQLVRKIDLYTDPAGLQAAIDWIKQQYTVHDIDILLGLFSRCYLGPPYVDHRLTITNAILEHYEPKDRVPAPFSAARELAANQNYDYIEVYADGRLIPVYPDGTTGDPIGI